MLFHLILASKWAAGIIVHVAHACSHCCQEYLNTHTHTRAAWLQYVCRLEHFAFKQHYKNRSLEFTGFTYSSFLTPNTPASWSKQIFSALLKPANFFLSLPLTRTQAAYVSLPVRFEWFVKLSDVHNAFAVDVRGLREEGKEKHGLCKTPLRDTARSLRHRINNQFIFIKSNCLKVCDCWFVSVQIITQDETQEDEIMQTCLCDHIEKWGYIQFKSCSQKLPTSHVKCIRHKHTHTHTLSKTKGPVGASLKEGKYLVKTTTTAEVREWQLHTETDTRDHLGAETTLHTEAGWTLDWQTNTHSEYTLMDSLRERKWKRCPIRLRRVTSVSEAKHFYIKKK